MSRRAASRITGLRALALPIIRLAQSYASQPRPSTSRIETATSSPVAGRKRSVW